MSQPEATPPGRLRRATGAGAGLVLGAVFLVAAAAKVLHPAQLEAQIVREGLGAWLPAGPLAVLVLALEAGLGAALLLGVRSTWVLAPTAGLVVAFMGLTGRTYWRALQGTLTEDAGCGCFGNLIERTPAEAFWSDLVLLVPPLLLLTWAAWPLPRRLPPVRTGIALALGLGTGVLATLAPDLPVDDWATRLRPGARLDELCAGSDPRVCLDDLAPGLREGHHWVILSPLDEALQERTQALNQAQAAGDGWTLWVLAPGESGEVDRFRWLSGPAFELVGEVPAPLLATLHRTLPRSFEVRDGAVVTTASGWPPWLEGDP